MKQSWLLTWSLTSQRGLKDTFFPSQMEQKVAYRGSQPCDCWQWDIKTDHMFPECFFMACDGWSLSVFQIWSCKCCFNSVPISSTEPRWWALCLSSQLPGFPQHPTAVLTSVPHTATRRHHRVTAALPTFETVLLDLELFGPLGPTLQYAWLYIIFSNLNQTLKHQMLQFLTQPLGLVFKVIRHPA